MPKPRSSAKAGTSEKWAKDRVDALQPRSHRAATSAATSKPHKPALSALQQRFILEYLKDLNGSAAYIRAGYAVKGPDVAKVNAARLLSNAHVRREVERRIGRTLQRLEISAENVVAEAWDIVRADARELISYEVGACRYCYGIGFQRMWTQGEYQAAQEATKAGDRADPEIKGGIGFDPRRDPNPDCPECFGKGAGRPFIADTRKLSPQAAALYAGVRQTKDGLQVTMHSKLDALEKVAKHVGAYEQDNRQKATPLAEAMQALVGQLHGQSRGLPFRSRS